MLRKIAIGVGALLGVGLLGVIVVVLVARRPLPEVAPSPQADELARAMMDAVHAEKWAETGAIQWTFNGRNRHLWDRDRGYVRVEGGTGRVLLRLTDKTGVAYKDNQPVPPDGLQRALDSAYAAFVNDSFWMMGPTHLFDTGTTRALSQDDDGNPGVLVRYSSGGVTPGDAYLWINGPGNLPTAWRMWVSALPIPGLRATWENWTTLDTGVVISVSHNVAGLARPTVDDVKAARTLAALVPGADPFAELEGAPPKAPAQPTAQPSSMPAH